LLAAFGACPIAPARATRCGLAELGPGGIGNAGGYAPCACDGSAWFSAGSGSPGSPWRIIFPVVMSVPAGTMWPNQLVHAPSSVIRPKLEGIRFQLPVALASRMTDWSKPDRPRPG